MRGKLLFAAVLAGAMLAVCSVRVHAQELFHLPAGTFCRLDELIRQEEAKAAAVTLLPGGTVLWMDGRPLAPYRAVAARDLERVFLFSAEETDIGVTLCTEKKTPAPLWRIRSVNPYFFEKAGQTIF